MTPATPLTPALPTRLAILVVAVALLVGCTPDPVPTPTPTAAFASEEEAFAAAEATYRAFTARLNDVDTTDPQTFEPLFELSSGEFEAADREAYANMHTNQVVVEGETKIISFVGTRSLEPFKVVDANVCLDVSEVHVTDSAGSSLVSPDRPSVYGLAITFVLERQHLTINSASIDTDMTC